MSEPWEYDEENEEEQAVEETRPHRVRRRHDTRGNLYLLTGLVIGLAIGLLFAWVISPVKYSDIDPASLPSAQQDEYRQVIALAYAADHDLPRASARLKLIDTGSAQQVLAAQAQRMLANKQSAQDARALAILAADIGNPPVMEQTLDLVAATEETPLGTPSATIATLGASEGIQTPTLPLPSSTFTLTPAPTFTPRPSATPLPVLDAPFSLKNKREVCDGSIPDGLIQLQVNDGAGKPVSGIKIVVTGQDKEDVFYTGLIPEVNPGFADFNTAAGVAYRIKVGEVSTPIEGIKAYDGCGWLLEFVQGEN